ncbi:hypothetical protein ACFL4S_00400 [bacterium]
MQEAQEGISEYFEYYNHYRRHQLLNYQHPWTVYTSDMRIAA